MGLSIYRLQSVLLFGEAIELDRTAAVTSQQI